MENVLKKINDYTMEDLMGDRYGKYAKYKSWKECVKDYKDSIQVKYHGGDYFSFLKKIHYSENPKYESILKNIIA